MNSECPCTNHLPSSANKTNKQTYIHKLQLQTHVVWVTHCHIVVQKFTSWGCNIFVECTVTQSFGGSTLHHQPVFYRPATGICCWSGCCVRSSCEHNGSACWVGWSCEQNSSGKLKLKCASSCSKHYLHIVAAHLTCLNTCFVHGLWPPANHCSANLN